MAPTVNIQQNVANIAMSVTAKTAGAQSSLSGLVTKAGLVVGALKAVSTAGSAVSLGVKMQAEAEQSQVAFTTMLGSAKTAKKVLGEIEQFSASTPFQLPELRDAGRNLAAFGFESSKIVSTLKRLGDISEGLNQTIGEIAEI